MAWGIGLSVWETAKIFGKSRRSVGNVSNMWGNDLIFWNLLKNVKWLDLGNWFKCLRKWLRDLGNGKIIGKWLRSMGHGLSIWETA